MDTENRKATSLSRRKILPILGSGFLLPLFGFANSKETLGSDKTNEAFKTLLKPDGTAVRVKISTLEKSKVIKKNVSNKSMLKWLGRKL